MTSVDGMGLAEEHFLSLVSIKYHKARVSFFEGVHRAVAFLSLIASSAAIAALLEDSSFLAAYLAAFVAVLQALDLVMQFSVKARVHADLAVRHGEIEKQLGRGFDDLKEVKRMRVEVEADEPRELWWLGLQMHNEVLLYQRGPSANLYKIPRRQRFGLSQISDFVGRRAVKEGPVNPGDTGGILPAE